TGKATGMPHAFITIVIPFNERRLYDVDKVLASLSNEGAGNAPRADINDRLDAIAIVHYMSIVAVSSECPAAASEDPRDRDVADSDIAHRMIEIAADGGVADALGVVIDTLNAELEDVLKAAEIRRDSTSLRQFLYDHHWKIDAGWRAPALGQVFTGSPGM